MKAANEQRLFRTFSSAALAVIGTPSRPFSIASEEALMDMAKKMSTNQSYEVDGQSYAYRTAAYRLDADITLSALAQTGIWGMASGFVFDGQNHKISGLTDMLFWMYPKGALFKTLCWKVI